MNCHKDKTKPKDKTGRMTSDIDSVIVIYGTFDEVPQKHWWKTIKEDQDPYADAMEVN